MTRYLIPAAIFAMVVIFLAIGLNLDPRKVPSPLIGKPTPNFSLTRLKEPGTPFSQDNLKGKVSLLNVWATWCVSCRAEHQVLMALADSGKVDIYGLNYKDKRQDALRWLQMYGDPYIANAFDENGRVGIDWGVYGTPETFLIDSQGIIRHKVIGPITAEILQNELLPMIEQLQTTTG
jgi:cytochrome c biogenesis protein CcmG/thiol:disulfide interchange protein DsbE